MSNEQWIVSTVKTTDILDLRMSVLRDGTPSQDPRYPQDDDPDALHLGIFEDETLIATSTWLDRPWPLDERRSEEHTSELQSH